MTDTGGNGNDTDQVLRAIEQHQRIIRSDVRWIMAMCLLWTVLGILVIVAAIFVIRDARMNDDASGVTQYQIDAALNEAAGLIPSCSETFEEGRVIATLDEASEVCMEDGNQQVYAVSDTDCADGRILWWNDWAWGYLGEPLHIHETGAELVAPANARAACTP